MWKNCSCIDVTNMFIKRVCYRGRIFGYIPNRDGVEFSTARKLKLAIIKWQIVIYVCISFLLNVIWNLSKWYDEDWQSSHMFRHQKIYKLIIYQLNWIFFWGFEKSMCVKFVLPTQAKICSNSVVAYFCLGTASNFQFQKISQYFKLFNHIHTVE